MAEICWYFTASSEQYRIHGRLDILTPDDKDESRQEERKKSFKSMSPFTK